MNDLTRSQAFGDVVRRRREGLGWSQEKLGQVLETDLSMIGRVERGTASPTLRYAHRLAVALDTTLSDLLREAGQ